MEKTILKRYKFTCIIYYFVKELLFINFSQCIREIQTNER